MLRSNLFTNHYLFNSRMLTHISFWVIYYITYSFLWADNGNYYKSFSLEFILMPIRISTAYLTIYYLVPKYLLKSRYVNFGLLYLFTLMVAGFLQSIFTHFFHESFFLAETPEAWRMGSIFRGMVLINTTVLLLFAIKMYLLWKEEKDKNKAAAEELIEIRSDKRTYRIRPSDIQYIEGLGNYATYYIRSKRPLISYTSLKEAEKLLSDKFIRIHKSFIVNKDWIDSYTPENVEINGRIIPVGKSVEPELF